MRGDAGFPIRLRFTKRGKVRFISHRDVARAFERAFRIDRLPLAFTQGFSPRPKVSFGLALSVGHESDAEYLDVELADVVDLPVLGGRLSAVLPEGIEVTGVAPLVDRAPALQESVTAVEYLVSVVRAHGSPVSEAAMRDATEGALALEAIPVTRTRKGRDTIDDLRPAIRELTVVGTDEHGMRVRFELATQPRGTRPAEVLMALGQDLVERRVYRTHQWIERGGARHEPLEADARPRVPEARAS